MPNQWFQDQLRTYNNGSAFIVPCSSLRYTIHVASMDGIYANYVHDGHVDNHVYDDHTDDDHDNKTMIAMDITMVVSKIILGMSDFLSSQLNSCQIK